MRRIPLISIFPLFLALLFLSGCPKRPPEIPHVEKPPLVNPMEKLFEAFSPLYSLQAGVSIRIEGIKSGDEMIFLLNGFLLYQKPERIRLIGYHPLGMGVFDAVYQNGQFFLLVPFQKRAYTGEISQFRDMIENAGEIRISTERREGSDAPEIIQIEVLEKEVRLLLRLKEISINPILSEDSFRWSIPEGFEVRPIAKLLKGKKPR